MRGLNIAGFHTGDDWGLILNELSLAPPTPKYTKVSVEGRDGDLDLSRALTGDIKFSNRPLNCLFLLTGGTRKKREAQINEIVNLLHGTVQDVILPDDITHFVKAECTISEIKNDKAYGSFRLTGDCEPYRYSVNETRRVFTLTSTAREVALVNSGRKKLVPTIEVSNSVTIVYGTSTVTLGAGTYKLADLALSTGDTLVKISGSGTVTFSYREGVL